MNYSSSDDSASSDASEFCPLHEDETSNESAEHLLTEESEFSCQDNPDYCPIHQHQCTTVVSSVQSSSSSGTLLVSVVEGPESHEIVRSAPKNRKISVGIVLPNHVSFMELSQLEMFVDSIIKIRSCKAPSVTNFSNFCNKCRFGWRHSYSFWIQTSCF